MTTTAVAPFDPSGGIYLPPNEKGWIRHLDPEEVPEDDVLDVVLVTVARVGDTLALPDLPLVYFYEPVDAEHPGAEGPTIGGARGVRSPRRP